MLGSRFFEGGFTWLRIERLPTMLEWLRGLNALCVLAQVSAAEQIVGRERNHGACHRQFVRDVVVSRRVNSDVIPLRFWKTKQRAMFDLSSK